MRLIWWRHTESTCSVWIRTNRMRTYCMRTYCMRNKRMRTNRMRTNRSRTNRMRNNRMRNNCMCTIRLCMIIFECALNEWICKLLKNLSRSKKWSGRKKHKKPSFLIFSQKKRLRKWKEKKLWILLSEWDAAAAELPVATKMSRQCGVRILMRSSLRVACKLQICNTFQLRSLILHFFQNEFLKLGTKLIWTLYAFLTQIAILHSTLFSLVMSLWILKIKFNISSKICT